MIEVSGLTKRYGATVAVDQLSFEVAPGAVTGFLGLNGSGKSSTMRMIMGLDRPDAGKALIGGRRYAELGWPLREVGALLEARTYHPGRSAYQHLAAPAILAGSTGTSVAKFFPTMIAGNSLAVSRAMPEVLSPWMGFAVLCLYVAVALGVGGWLLARRDA